MLGVCSVIIGGTLAGLAATGPGAIRRRRALPGRAPAAAASGTGRLNATSPARVAGSPAPQRPTPGAGKAGRASASPSATAAAPPESVRDGRGLVPVGPAGTVVAAVYDIGTGRTWDLGHGGPQAEASVVKLDILETLLAERGRAAASACRPVTGRWPSR